MNLREINIPKSIKSIGSWAFNGCKVLLDIELPEGLDSIAHLAFKGCSSIKKIIFPSTLRVLGGESCTEIGVEEVYCKAETPPLCKNGVSHSDYTPFGGFDSPSTPRGAKVYVPIGCADKYRNTWGWNYFTNFIETANFPTGVERVVTSTPVSKRSLLYDLMGKRISHPSNGQIYIKGGKKYVYQEK